jgi:nitric oxide reductase NorD protein
VTLVGDDAPLARFGTLASALAGRAMALAPSKPDELPWTDGRTIYLDPAMSPRTILEVIAVQASLVAAGSLDADLLRAVGRRTRVAERYLGIEGHRALVANAGVLPAALSALADLAAARRSDSPAASLLIATGPEIVDAAPPVFGILRPKKVLAAIYRVAKQVDHEAVGHVPRDQGKKELEELDDGEVADPEDGPDLFTSPVGGAGAIGKWLKKLFGSQRQSDASGGGPPGADSPTHRTNGSNRGARAVSSLASAGSDEYQDVRADGVKYPEWDFNRTRYRLDWCTVREVEPRIKQSSSQAIEDAPAMRRPLARLGMGMHRRHRQAQGDDIDIDAAVEARVELRAGSMPDESVYLDSLRRRRDLSVLVLLDVSGSAAEAGTVGKTVHQQQLTAAANLVVALHDLGDRVALYGYNSQGRQTVNMLPVKRFDDRLDARTIRRLNSLEPAAYSRLGAAIRHGSAVLEAQGGTSRRLLVVISDGLAYDHGYERDYGAADARRALTEARRRGTGCVCLTVGAKLDTVALQRVFGTAAHASIDRPDQLVCVIGPLFRAALRWAEVRRRVS